MHEYDKSVHESIHVLIGVCAHMAGASLWVYCDDASKFTGATEGWCLHFSLHTILPWAGGKGGGVNRRTGKGDKTLKQMMGERKGDINREK